MAPSRPEQAKKVPASARRWFSLPGSSLNAAASVCRQPGAIGHWTAPRFLKNKRDFEEIKAKGQITCETLLI
jgi:hypothetical protein